MRKDKKSESKSKLPKMTFKSMQTLTPLQAHQAGTKRYGRSQPDMTVKLKPKI